MSPPSRANLYQVTARWEYKVIPKIPQRRFVAVGSREEYAEASADRGATSTWYVSPRSGLDPTSSEAFELVQFSIDGEPQKVRRSTRRRSQTYVVNVGEERIAAGDPVTVAYTYRTTVTRDGNLLYLNVEQPTRDLQIEFDYAGCGIEQVSVLDLVPGIRPARVERPSAELPGQVIRVDLNGWAFPRSGVGFVWRSKSNGLTEPTA